VQVTASFDICKYGDQGWLSGGGSCFAFQELELTDGAPWTKCYFVMVQGLGIDTTYS